MRIILIFISVLFFETSISAAEFRFDWSTKVNQKWIGRHFWQNSYRDWQQANGRIEVTHPGGNRSAVVTSFAINASNDFEITMRMGQLQAVQTGKSGWGGFKLGLQGNRIHTENWKNQMIHCMGTPAGITSDGKLFVDQIRIDAPKITNGDNLTLKLTSKVSGNHTELRLTAVSESGSVSVSATLPVEQVSGMFALSSHNGKIDQQARFDDGKANDAGSLAHWFDEFEANGAGIISTPERQFGPVAFNQFLTSSGTLRMNTQLTPFERKYVESIDLEISENNSWRKIATGKYDQPSSSALFTVPHWDINNDIDYRIVWKGIGFDGELYTHYYSGMIRAEPTKEDVVLGSFNCMHWTGFPYQDSVEQMRKIKPHILAFTGDQLYEGAGGYGIVTSPLEESRLNYFQHWFLHGLAFRELLAGTACMTINDDHDVFHGNVWGESGKATDANKTGAAAQDSGGYKMPPQFVNLVQRGQCGHLPPSPDTSPVKQGIETYYTDVRFAGISFAVLEDRKWKSAPQNIHTDTEVYNGYFKDPEYAKDTAHIRKVSADADLLGNRQEAFLEQWAADWSEGTWMKCAVSQTVFNTAATDGLNNNEPWDRYADENFPVPGAWPSNTTNPSHDMDSNGWPQDARDRSVHLLRKAFAPHIAGDQHLGSTIRYGIEEHDSGSVAFCVPAASTGWSRLWMPKAPGVIDETFIGNIEGDGFTFDPRNYTGKFLDGQGNKFTMLATANPYKQNKRKPTWYHDRNPGYGIVTFHRESHEITLTAWPSFAGPQGKGDAGHPYAGWPITIQQTDNYARIPQGFIPEVKLKDNPVIQVINDSTGEIEYTIRPAGETFRPHIFDLSANYTLRTGDPDSGVWDIKEGLRATK
ncbi:MAG: hypothetical protein O3C43_17380 [Verrucomicrobia bacterium]|nr:hypothetical protein [Verrucomicrobiota bacterium]MDA1068263.1 hypothetical protein [Verrucomicrobiota bacterium]